MNKIIKFFSIILFAGFSFYYSEKVTSIIRKNDPIMKDINTFKEEKVVSKIEPIVLNDEYITGINGCIVDEKKSYNKMKNNGSYQEELLVMKEDKVKEYDKYIIGGNKETRKISIIFTNLLNEKLNNYIKNKNIKINYFLDGNFIEKNIDLLKEVSNYSNIYNYGRNREYDDKYLSYDNYIIKKNFNSPDYCLVTNKDSDILKLCKKYNMKTIKSSFIKDNKYGYIKENLKNGNIFLMDNISNSEFNIIINYIMSKGYEIVDLNNLLDSSKKCNKS